MHTKNYIFYEAESQVFERNATFISFLNRGFLSL